MKKIILLLVFIISFYSCREAPYTFEQLILKNSTEYPVHITVFEGNQITYENLVDPNSKEIINNIRRGKHKFWFYPFITADSVQITFDGQYSTMHYRDPHPHNAIRNILDISNWEEIKNEKDEIHGYYKYRYTFGEADYNEAVNGS